MVFAQRLQTLPRYEGLLERLSAIKIFESLHECCGLSFHIEIWVQIYYFSIIWFCLYSFIYYYLLRATRRLQRGMVQLVSEGYLLHTTKNAMFSYFYSWLYDWSHWTNFWPLQKLKKVICIPPGFLSQKRTFVHCFWNDWTENFEMMFFGYRTKDVS